jgi:hypothetical protein
MQLEIQVDEKPVIKITKIRIKNPSPYNNENLHLFKKCRQESQELLHPSEEAIKSLLKNK